MPIRIYIITDMEGVSGISREEQTAPPDSPHYQAARRLLCGDVNAAIAGAFDGGADEVFVNDGHGTGFNFILEDMDQRAIYERPRNAIDIMPALDDSFAGVFCVGYHAMAGTQDAFLDHTQDPRGWLNYSLNERRTGELGQMGAWAGSYNVPVLVVTGDEAACVEAREFFGEIETVAVKQGLGRQSARCIHPEIARAMIRKGAQNAMSLIGKAQSFHVQAPLTIRLECQRTDLADALAQRTHTRRIDGRTVERTVQDARHLLDF